MDKQKCTRCSMEEHIPTHQFLKFDDRVNYVCKRCWEQFRKWFLGGGKGGNPYYESAS